MPSLQKLDHFDVVIVGGGVIGLAAAYKLSTHPRIKNNSLVLLERHRHIGQEISSRNSEVIHAGIYYPQHSLKASLCLDGREQLYHYCRTFDIPYRQTGKLIVARPGQEDALEKIAAQVRRNGVADLKDIDQEQLRQLEPALAAGIALLSLATGIIDSHAYMASLLQQAEANGLIFSPLTEVVAIAPHPRGYCIDSHCQDTAYRFTCEKLINAAGLSAQQVAMCLTDFPSHAIPGQILVKGNYFSLQGKSPFSHLIYPVPEANLKGLGIHVTLDMAGQVRFGPDTQVVTHLDYEVDVSREHAFRDAIRRYFPAIDQCKLAPAYSGIRPKLAMENGVADFIIQSGEQFGFEGLVQLFGIESPGLTASLAIADKVINTLFH